MLNSTANTDSPTNVPITAPIYAASVAPHAASASQVDPLTGLHGSTVDLPDLNIQVLGEGEGDHEG